MRNKAFLLILILITMTAQPIVASDIAPNATSPTNQDTISVDGFVTTKFTSVGDTIEIFANTKGHSGNVQTT